MSLYEDFDGYFEHDYPFGLPCDIWKSKHGDIKLKDMTTTHIISCMKIVGEDDAWYGRFTKELERRGKYNLFKRRF